MIFGYWTIIRKGLQCFIFEFPENGKLFAFCGSKNFNLLERKLVKRWHKLPWEFDFAPQLGDCPTKFSSKVSWLLTSPSRFDCYFS